MTNPYADLDVPADASAAEIKAAYRRKAKQAHPDNGGSADEFSKVNRAKLVLLDPERRRKFDQSGAVDEGVDDEMARAMNIVTGVIDSVFTVIQNERGDPANFDVLGDARKMVGDQIEQTRNQIAENDRIIKVLRKTAARFKPKRGKVNRISSLLDSRARQIEEGNAGNRKNLGAMEAAYTILKDHDYEWERSPGAESYGAQAAANMFFQAFSQR